MRTPNGTHHRAWHQRSPPRSTWCPRNARDSRTDSSSIEIWRNARSCPPSGVKRRVVRVLRSGFSSSSIAATMVLRIAFRTWLSGRPLPLISPKRRAIGCVVPEFRRRDLDGLSRPFEPDEDAVSLLDGGGEVGRHDDMLVVRRAVGRVGPTRSGQGGPNKEIPDTLGLSISRFWLHIDVIHTTNTEAIQGSTPTNILHRRASRCDPHTLLVALLVLTVTGAAHAAPSHGKLYDKKVDIAAAKILWGNQTRPTKPRDTLAIDPPFQRFGSEETRVEVLEFFAYNAHRTRSGPRKRWGKRADDVMERWRDSLPERVTVIRVPFAWQKLPNEPGYARVRRGHLRSILTAQVLGIEDRVHQRMVKALDDDTRAFSNQASARAHFEALGVSAERFSKAWDSPEARRRSRLAAELRDTLFETSIRHGGTHDRLTPPPIFIINGEHMVATFNTRNAEKSFQVANHLIAEALKPDPDEAMKTCAGAHSTKRSEGRRLPTLTGATNCACAGTSHRDRSTPEDGRS